MKTATAIKRFPVQMQQLAAILGLESPEQLAETAWEVRVDSIFKNLSANNPNNKNSRGSWSHTLYYKPSGLKNRNDPLTPGWYLHDGEKNNLLTPGQLADKR